MPPSQPSPRPPSWARPSSLSLSHNSLWPSHTHRSCALLMPLLTFLYIPSLPFQFLWDTPCTLSLLKRPAAPHLPSHHTVTAPSPFSCSCDCSSNPSRPSHCCWLLQSLLLAPTCQPSGTHQLPPFHSPSLNHYKYPSLLQPPPLPHPWLSKASRD